MKKHDEVTRVAPPDVSVATPGTTAEESRGSSTAAERPDPEPFERIVVEMREAVFQASQERGFLKIEGWADRLAALVWPWRAAAAKDHAHAPWCSRIGKPCECELKDWQRQDIRGER